MSQNNENPFAGSGNNKYEPPSWLAQEEKAKYSLAAQEEAAAGTEPSTVDSV